jgi:hypothetical protein
MKLDFDSFPVMKNLTADVRQKAVEFAESLGARGPRPTTALGTAVTLAREWKSGRLPARPISAPFLVQPRAGRWIIKRSTDAQATHTFLRMDDAVRRAQQLARDVGAACFVFGPGGALIQRFEARAIAEMDLPSEPIVEAAIPEPASVAGSEPAYPSEPTATTLPPPSPDALTHAGADGPAPCEVAAISPDEAATALAPITVKKIGGKWAVLVDGRAEVLATRAKAIKRAFELGHALNRRVTS